jgi:peptide-methionine (S)-S-oxide reductase
MNWGSKSLAIPTADEALPGRTATMPIPPQHYVNGNPLVGPWPDGMETAVFGMGCFWGAERKFWELDGVYSTSVGYAAGHTPNATYEEVCSGRTGHTEVVLVVFDPSVVSFERLCQQFWESHNPTQGMRQGNDVGTQYRSGIYVTTDEQLATALATRDRFQEKLTDARFGEITSEIEKLGEYYYAEPYHQQYLAKNPNGYCGIGGTGVSCPIGVVAGD